MDVVGKFTTLFIDMILPLLVGYALRRSSRGSERVFNWMISLGIIVLFPGLTAFSIWGLVPVFDLIWLPLFGVLLHIIPGALALVWGRRKYDSSLDYGSYAISGFLSNHVTLGSLSAYILYGETGYAYTQMTLLFNSLLMFGFAYPLAQHYRNMHDHGKGLRIDLKQILFNRNQLPLVGMLVGIILNWQGVHRPESFLPVFDMMIHFSAWTFLIPVGYSMDFGEVRHYWRDALDITFIKCVITPVLIVAIAGLFIRETIAFRTLVLLAAQPTAVNAVIAMKLFGLNLHLSVGAFVLSTAVYLLIIFPAFFIF
jgi:predicted permease